MDGPLGEERLNLFVEKGPPFWREGAMDVSMGMQHPMTIWRCPAEDLGNVNSA